MIPRLEKGPESARPAHSRTSEPLVPGIVYAATTPNLLRWFKRYNRGKPYREQVRPFGFLLAYQSA